MFFFFDVPVTTVINTLSLHDALPICLQDFDQLHSRREEEPGRTPQPHIWPVCRGWRSEEHTSELQSRRDLVCRLLLEKKKCILILYHDYDHRLQSDPRF